MAVKLSTANMSTKSRADPPTRSLAFKNDPSPRKINNNNDDPETKRLVEAKAICRALFWFGLGFLLSLQLSLVNPRVLEYETLVRTTADTSVPTTTATSADPDADPDTAAVDLAASLNLDDPEYLNGYAPSRILFKDLNFCDIGQNGIKRGSGYHKPTTCFVNDTLDPTCEKCLKPNNLKDYRMVWDTYEKNATMRRQMLGEALGSEGSIVIIVSNKPYLHMAKNWLCHASENGLQQQNLIMYAIDDATEEWAKSQGIYTVRPSLYSFNIRGFVSATKFILFPLLGDLLHMGRHVVFNDVDLLWTSNLTHNLQNVWPDIPLVTQNAPRWDAQGPLNSGMLSLRPTTQTKIFVETLMETIPIFLSGIQGRSDQLMWNRLLLHHKFRTLPWRTLPDQLILNAGWDPKLKKFTNQTWCIHWVGVHDGTDSYSSLSKSCASVAKVE